MKITLREIAAGHKECLRRAAYAFENQFKRPAPDCTVEGDSIETFAVVRDGLQVMAMYQIVAEGVILRVELDTRNGLSYTAADIAHQAKLCVKFGLTSKQHAKALHISEERLAEILKHQ